MLFDVGANILIHSKSLKIVLRANLQTKPFNFSPVHPFNTKNRLKHFVLIGFLN